MIACWGKLQLSLGSDNHGRGAFPLDGRPPATTSRSSSKEQVVALCRSHSDRAGPEPLSDSGAFLGLKKALVENLVGALVNAVDILDGNAYRAGGSAALTRLLGFEASGRHHDLELSTEPSQVYRSGEPLQFRSHDRASHGNTLHSVPFSSSVGTVSSADRGRGHHDVSVNPVRSAQPGLGHGDSEEDFLLQEARYRAFRGLDQPEEWRNTKQAGASSDELLKTVDARPHCLQEQEAKVDSRCERPVAVSNDALRSSKLEAQTETGKFWTFAEIMPLSSGSSLFWGEVAISMVIAGALFVTFGLFFFIGGQPQRPSVKRRILRSQWYGNPGMQSGGHRNFQMRISDFPKYPILEVDGDKKLLRLPFDTSVTPAANFKRGSQWSSTTNGQVLATQKAQWQPIRQSFHGSKEFPARQSRLHKDQLHGASNDKALSDSEVIGLSKHRLSGASDNHDDAWERERDTGFSQPRTVSRKDKVPTRVMPHKRFSLGGSYRRKAPDLLQENDSIKEADKRTSRMSAFTKRTGHNQWGEEDELDLDRRIKKLYHTVQAVEQHRRAAMLALAEERQRSMALEDEMVKQREAAAVLGEEVRLLKESHNALLTSLRKKYSSSASARAAADLLYQDWEGKASTE